MTRPRAHTCNDNAQVEQKNGDIVRRSAFRYRYDTAEELALLGELWGLVNLRKNLFLPTKKANGWRTTKAGRNTHTYYDQPKTPYQRLRDEAGFLTPPAQHQLQALHETTNPAELTRNINRTKRDYRCRGLVWSQLGGDGLGVLVLQVQRGVVGPVVAPAAPQDAGPEGADAA